MVLESGGGGGRASSAAGPLPACPTVGMRIEMGPGSGTGIEMCGFRARFPPREALSLACKVGSGYRSSGIREPVVVRGSSGGLYVENRGPGREIFPGFEG